MKAIILAAGRGSRFGLMAEGMPKCMMLFAGVPLLKHQLDVLAEAGIRDLCIVKGHLGDRVVAPGARVYWNRDYADTNMVCSLFAAESELFGDVIITYGDVIYDQGFLDTVLAFSGMGVGVAVDVAWHEYYSARFGDAFIDAESLRLSPEMMITDIGRRSPLVDDIRGQYVGVIRLSHEGCEEVRRVYRNLCSRADADWEFRGRKLRHLYMTDLLQLVINAGVPVHGIPVRNGWLEFDSEEDLRRATDWWRTGVLGRFYRMSRPSTGTGS